MYTKHFGLTEEPFSIAANPRFLYMSESHREALGHLLYGIGSDSGFVLLTGEVGTGKTTVCRCLLQQLPENTEVAYILNPRVSAIEMLGGICDELGIDYTESDNNSIKSLVDAINRHLLQRHADGKQTVVIIDEAQNLSFDVLEQLRLLTNLETDERKLLRIILIGQPELASMLASPELKQVEQRITARYYLRALQRSEIGAYVSHRLAVAGRRKVIFPPGVLPKLYAKTRGIPRLINVICDRAMLGAYVKAQSRVNASILEKAAREVQGRPVRTGWLLPGSVIASVLLVGAATAAVFFYDGGQKISMLLSQPEIEMLPEPDILIDTGSNAFQEEAVFETNVDVSQDAPIPEWPDQLVVGESTLITAQLKLFKQWNIPLAEDNSDPCGLAGKSGVRCFSGTGNLGSLIDIDRPAVLTLVSDDGLQYHATLLALNDDLATLAFAHGIEKVGVGDLETRWRGKYQLLWRLSPDGNSIFRPGDRGGGVTWLTKSLQAAGVKSVQVHDVYDANVVGAVRTFQLGQGLLVDGVVGRQTLIHLNSVSGNPVPRLGNHDQEEG